MKNSNWLTLRKQLMICSGAGLTFALVMRQRRMIADQEKSLLWLPVKSSHDDEEDDSFSSRNSHIMQKNSLQEGQSKTLSSLSSAAPRNECLGKDDDSKTTPDEKRPAAD